MKILSTICYTTIFFTIQSTYCQSIEENKEIAKRYLEEVVNERKLETIDEIFAPVHTRHELLNGKYQEITVAEQKARISKLFIAFPDIHYEIGDAIAEGDRVAVRATFHGTHEGPILGIQPTGNYIDYLSEILFFRIQDGKIVERWMQLDLHNVLKKLKEEN